MKLYKYMPFVSAKRILTEGCIRFTPPTAFNDPFELNPSFDLFSKQDIENLPDDPANPGQKLLSPEAIQEMLWTLSPGISRLIGQHKDQSGSFSLRNNAIAQFTLDSEFGILCLTEEPTNLLMWAHYGDQHRGIVLQFDADHPYFSSEKIFSGKVGYTNRRPIHSYTSIKEPNVFFTKSAEWSYENEWRFIRRLNDADLVLDIESDLIHLFSLPPEVITGIVIGVGVSASQRLEIIELCQKPPLEHLTIFQTRLCDVNYELEIHPPLDGASTATSVNGVACGARDSDGNVDYSKPSLMLMIKPSEDIDP